MYSVPGLCWELGFQRDETQFPPPSSAKPGIHLYKMYTSFLLQSFNKCSGSYHGPDAVLGLG